MTAITYISVQQRPFSDTTVFIYSLYFNGLTIWQQYCRRNGRKRGKTATMDRQISKEVKQKERRNRILKYAAAGATISAIIAGMIFFSQKSVEEKKLEFCTVDRGDIEICALANGTVVPIFEQVMNSPINSRIIEVYCKQGSEVEAGTPIMKLDLQSTESDYHRLMDEEKMKRYQLEQLRANNETALSDMAMKIEVSQMRLAQLEAGYRNEKYLDSIGSGTTEKVRQAELAYRTGKLELEQQQKQYSNAIQTKNADLKIKELEYDILKRNLSLMKRTFEDAQIKSPAKGILTFVNTRIGEQVTTGSHIATISDLGSFMVDATIIDTYAAKVLPGGKVSIEIDGNYRTGTINSVNPLSKDGMISFTVMPDNPHEQGLRSGLAGTVHVILNKAENVLRLKYGPFYVGKGEYQLYVKTEQNRLDLRKVTLGNSGKGYMEVLGGLNENDEVVVSDMARFKGMKTLKLKD